MPRGRRTYTRDANGRFSSTPGGISGLGAARKAYSPGAQRKKAQPKGGTLAARSSLKTSRAKLAAMAKPSSAQKGAVTRGSRKLASVQAQARRQAPAMTNVLRGKAVAQAKQQVKARGAQQPESVKSFTPSSVKPAPIKKPAATKPKTAADKKALQKQQEIAARQQRARKIKEVVNRRGVVKGKNFNDGQDVQTLSMGEMRKQVRQFMKKAGVEDKKGFRFATGENPPTTRTGWENLYRRYISAPMSDRNRKQRPGIVNGIDIQKNFRPWAVFGLDPKTASRDDVQAAYRRVAKIVHPDAGGRAKDLDRVKKMRDSVLAMMDTNPSGPSRPSRPKPRKSKAPDSSPPSRPKGPLLLMPAKSETGAGPRKKRGKT